MMDSGSVQRPRSMLLTNAPWLMFCLLFVMLQSSQAQDDATYEVSAAATAHLTRLAEHTQIRSAFAFVDSIEAELLDLMIELTEIPAPPFEEQARGERFAELLQEAGLDEVSIDAVGNVIGVRPGRDGSKTIALTAHLDTVFPADTDVTVRIEGDTYYAPGIGDNTRGLVVLLAILRAMQHAQIETDADVLFVGNVGEEGLGDLRGVKHLFRDGARKIDTMIAIDGGSSNRIIWGGIGSHRYRVTFSGPGGHSWGAFGAANPHHALGRAIALFDQRAPAVTRHGEKTSYNVGIISGGTSVNSIPFESSMQIDMRSGDQGKLDDIDAVLQSAVQQALQEENADRSRGPALTVAVERIGTRPASRGERNSTLVQHAAAAMRVVGMEPQLRLSSTDANFPLSIGVPAITLSRGGVGKDAHAPSESWTNKDGHLAIQLGMLTLLAETGMAE